MATYADIAHLPEGENVEIIGGEVILSPRSRPAHGRVQAGLSRYVGGPFDFDGDTAGIPPFEAVEIEVGALFPPLD